MFAHEHGPRPERLDAVVVELDRFISPASKTLRFGLLAMLGVVRFAPVLLLLRLSTFETLPFAERVRVLERMATSPWVVLALVLAAYKAILSLLYFEQDDELVALGYRHERHRHRRGLLQEAAE